MGLPFAECLTRKVAQVTLAICVLNVNEEKDLQKVGYIAK